MPIGNFREPSLKVFCGDCNKDLGIFPIPEDSVVFCGDCGMVRIEAICEESQGQEADCGE
jgi:ribosomal protein S27E